VPVRGLLDPPAPTPFNPSPRVAFSLEKPQRIRLSVHDLAGRLVRTLIDGTRPFGHGSVIWDGRDEQGRSLPTGSYIVRFATKTVVESRKVTLVE
nr:hypothetical protein [bacterium]